MDKNSYTLKQASISYIFCLVLVLAVSVVLTNVVYSVASISGDSVENVLSKEWINYLNMFLSALVFYMVYLVINLVLKKNVKTASRLKFKFSPWIVVAVCVVSVVVMFASINTTGLFNFLASHVSSQNLTNTFPVNIDTFGKFLLIVLLLGILPAVGEELVFRGIIYNGLRQRFGAKISVILSAVLFMLIHLSIYKTFYQFILGLILGALVYYTGTIFYGIIFHFSNNFVIILLNYLSHDASMFEFASWGFREVALSLLFFAIGAVVVILFFALLKRQTKSKSQEFDLEPNFLPLESHDVLANSNLSEYDKSVILEKKSQSENTYLIVGILFAVLFWGLSSFGGI